jgi:hypothetical protein
MDPTQILRVFLDNIERTRAAMEDGPTGYVLQFATRMHLLCVNNRGKTRKDHPLNDDVTVLTSHARAVTMQRFWNHEHPDDKVKIILRREAMTDYIDAQQVGVDNLQRIIEFTRSTS